MDASHFDRFIRSLTASHSRRTTARMFLLGTLGQVGLSEASAKKRKGKKRKKSRGHTSQTPICPPGKQFCPDLSLCGECCSSADCCGADPCPPGSQTCLAGLRCGVSCSDQVRNGSETDVDCGGSCARCVNGKVCATRADCVGGLCAGGTCQACAVDGDCGSDGDGFCYCAEPATGGPKVCTKANQTGSNVMSCASCPIDTFCFNEGTPGIYYCFKPCGAPY
jgi:hypothetical protein